MNSFKRVIAGAILTATSFGIAGALEAQNVEASQREPIQQGIYDIPDNCPDYNGLAISIETEKALRNLGFTGIKPNGIVDEQGAVLGVQKFMQEIGVIDKDVEVCGYAGPVTLEGVRKMERPGDLAGESQLNNNSSSTNSNITKTPDSDIKYSLEDCDKYEEWSVETIKAVQKAIGVEPDGVFGSVSCSAMINFQESRNIAQYGRGFLGARTLSALGVVGKRASETNSNANNSSKVVDGCIARYDVDYVICADTGPGTETGYLYKRNNDGSQTLMNQFEITSSQIDTDGTNNNGDTLTRKGHHIVGYATRKTPKVGLRNYLQFAGGQGVHAYNYVGAEFDSHGCIRVTAPTSEMLYKELALNSRAAFTNNVEVIIK